MKINYFILPKNSLQGSLIYKAFIYDLNKIILFCATIYFHSQWAKNVLYVKTALYIPKKEARRYKVLTMTTKMNFIFFLLNWNILAIKIILGIRKISYLHVRPIYFTFFLIFFQKTKMLASF